MKKSKKILIFPDGALPCWTCSEEAVVRMRKQLVCLNCGNTRKQPPRVETTTMVRVVEVQS